MSRIRVLDKNIANKIAAGEVIERPASVIKELLENSIDAGSTSISVEIMDGGLSQIRVADNGVGIEVEDVETAFLRHATSKISHENDLFNIATLGFRGEALASIAAVSNIRLKTRTKDAEFGTEVLVSGGIIDEILPCGCPNGTVIEVSDLFFNIPARLKFMKSPRNEAGHITDYISRMILAKPEIEFRYMSGGRPVYHSSGDGLTESAIYTIYGDEIVSHIKPVEYSDGYVKISGFVGSEIINRPTRASQSFFVNGRYIRSQKISAALSEAYDTRIMNGRFPFAVLSFDMEYSEVDVNVHPNKLEIRFKNEPLLLDAITGAVKRALGGYYAPLIETDESIILDKTESLPELVDLPMGDESSKASSEPTEQYYSEVSFDNTFKSATVDIIKDSFKLPDSSGSAIKATEDNAVTLTPDEPTLPPLFLAPETPKPAAKATQMEFTSNDYKFLCNIFDAFWFIQQDETIFVVDQHAAHERLLYEQTMRGELRTASQLLLVPETVTLTAPEFEIYEENRDLFFEFGFDIEQFGTFTLRILAVPHILGKAQKSDFLRDAIALLSKTKGINVKDIKRDALITASCKSAIKAGNMIPQEMMSDILAEFKRGETPMTCPHGRPIMVAITKNNILKMFKRVI